MKTCISANMHGSTGRSLLITSTELGERGLLLDRKRTTFFLGYLNTH